MPSPDLGRRCCDATRGHWYTPSRSCVFCNWNHQVKLYVPFPAVLMSKRICCRVSYPMRGHDHNHEGRPRPTHFDSADASAAEHSPRRRLEVQVGDTKGAGLLELADIVRNDWDAENWISSLFGYVLGSLNTDPCGHLYRFSLSGGRCVNSGSSSPLALST